MNREEALLRSEQVRGQHEVSPAAVVSTVEQKYIELRDGPSTEPGPVRDVAVWIVRFQAGIAWKDLAIGDRTGEVVRVEQSR